MKSLGPLLIVAYLGLFAGHVRAAASERPNILWLIAEDFGPHLGCYGTKEVASLNLDGLASRGMRFTRLFTTAPVCSPSRSAFMTGMYQGSISAQEHRTADADKKPLPAGVRLLTDHLREAGYFTANVIELPPPIRFKGTGKTDWNFLAPERPFHSQRWQDLKDHQPFYAQINFNETHRKFKAPPKADPDKVEVPPYYPGHPVVREDWAAYLDSASELDRKVGRVLELLEADGLADNTIVVFFGDNGQAHVRGKQFCYDSGLLVPLIVYWPPGLEPSAGYQRGGVSDRLLEAIDLTAQTLAWAGVQRPSAMQGRVFLGASAEPPREVVFGARDRCDETVLRFRTARDTRYRYIRNLTPGRPLLLANAYKERAYPVWRLLKQPEVADQLTTPAQRLLVAPSMPAEELYDTKADPHETVNLVASDEPTHKAALDRLRMELEEWREESHDPELANGR
jgi:N-sulfoglucosamine sulfohydrolase